MFKLPTCPYCNTIYSYKDVKKLIFKSTNCYHCKKNFKAKLIPGIFILIAIILLLAITVNVLILSSATKLDFITMVLMFFMTIFFLVLGYFLIPFFVTFKKTEKEEKEKLRWRV